MSPPRVFGEGTITVVIGPEPWPYSMQVYVGPHKVESLKIVSTEVKEFETTVVATLPAASGREEEDLRVEQDARLLSVLSWLKIRREK
jgi:hypothetical protein